MSIPMKIDLSQLINPGNAGAISQELAAILFISEVLRKRGESAVTNPAIPARGAPSALVSLSLIGGGTSQSTSSEEPSGPTPGL